MLIFSLSFMLFSCENDEIENLNFNTEYLKQTQWIGKLHESERLNGETINHDYNVGLIFYTDNEGRSNVGSYDSNFKYSIDNKLLTITKGYGVLNGKWLLIQFDKEKMVLEKGTGGDDSYKATLTLTKKH